MGLDVIFADARARARSLDRVNVHAQFAGQTPHVRRGGNRVAMFDARHLAQLRRHAERFFDHRRQIGRQRLFFGFSFGSHGRLESQARSLLPGTMFDGSMVHRLGRRAGSAFERKDHLADFYFFPFFDQDILHHARRPRRELRPPPCRFRAP